MKQNISMVNAAETVNAVQEFIAKFDRFSINDVSLVANEILSGTDISHSALYALYKLLSESRFGIHIVTEGTIWFDSGRFFWDKDRTHFSTNLGTGVFALYDGYVCYSPWFRSNGAEMNEEDIMCVLSEGWDVIDYAMELVSSFVRMIEGKEKSDYVVNVPADNLLLGEWFHMGREEDEYNEDISNVSVVGLNEGDVLSCTIDYPLDNPCTFSVTWRNDVNAVVSQVRQKYNDIYEEEDASSTIVAEPYEYLCNRNMTNGKWGIWGHTVDDLILERMSVDIEKRELVLSMGS